MENHEQKEQKTNHEQKEQKTTNSLLSNLLSKNNDFIRKPIHSKNTISNLAISLKANNNNNNHITTNTITSSNNNTTSSSNNNTTSSSNNNTSKEKQKIFNLYDDQSSDCQSPTSPQKLQTAFRLKRQSSNISPNPNLLDYSSPSSSSLSTWSPSHIQIRRKMSYSVLDPPPLLSNASAAASFMNRFNQSFSSTPAQSQIDADYAEGDEIGDYKLVKQIGSGAFSKVFEAETDIEPHPAHHSSNNTKKFKVAIKIIKKTDDDDSNSLPADLDLQHLSQRLSIKKINQKLYQQQIDKETAIWSRLQHPNILMMNDMIRLPDALIIVSELAPKGTLLSYIQKHGQPGLTEPLAKTFFIQLSQAIHYLHTIVGIIHHDIKLENILLDEELTVKLADFGLSEEMELIEQADVDRGQNVYEPNTMKSTDRHSAKTNDPPGNEHFSKDTKLQTNKDSTSKQVSKDTKLETSKNQKPKEITKKPEPTLKYLNPQFQSDIFSTPYATKSKLETNFININPYHHHRQSGHPPDCPGFCCTIHQPTSEKFQLHIPRVRNRDHNVHAGSLHYLAPEELRAASATYIDPRKDPNSIMNLTKPYCDIWALGCCLYALVVGTLPFSDSFLPRLQMKIINGQFDHGKLVSARISRDCILLLERLLDVSIDTRYTIEQVLESDWVKS